LSYAKKPITSDYIIHTLAVDYDICEFDDCSDDFSMFGGMDSPSINNVVDPILTEAEIRSVTAQDTVCPSAPPPPEARDNDTVSTVSLDNLDNAMHPSTTSIVPEWSQPSFTDGLCDTNLSLACYYLDVEIYCVCSSDAPTKSISGYMDSGAMVSTTAHRFLLWGYKTTLPYHVCLCVADQSPHYPVGFGYLRVPSPNVDGGHTMVPCFHTPSIPVTIVSPSNLARTYDACSFGYHCDLDGSSRSYVEFLFPPKLLLPPLHIPLHGERDLLYTNPLVPCDAMCPLPPCPVPAPISSSKSSVHALSAHQTRLL